MKEFQIHSVETVSEVGQKSNLQIVKGDQNVKRIQKHRTSPDVQFKEVSLTNQKTRPRTMSELEKPNRENQIQKILKKSMSKRMLAKITSEKLKFGSNNVFSPTSKID